MAVHLPPRGARPSAGPPAADPVRVILTGPRPDTHCGRLDRPRAPPRQFGGLGCSRGTARRVALGLHRSTATQDPNRQGADTPAPLHEGSRTLVPCCPSHTALMPAAPPQTPSSPRADSAYRRPTAAPVAVSAPS